MKETKQYLINYLKNETKYKYILDYIIYLINIENNNKKKILDEINTVNNKNFDKLSKLIIKIYDEHKLINQKMDNQQKLIDIITKNVVSNIDDDKLTIRELLHQILKMKPIIYENAPEQPLIKGKGKGKGPPPPPPKSKPPASAPPQQKPKSVLNFTIDILKYGINKSIKEINDAKIKLDNDYVIREEAKELLENKKKELTGSITNIGESLKKYKSESKSIYNDNLIKQLTEKLSDLNNQILELSIEKCIEIIKNKYNEVITNAKNMIKENIQILKDNYNVDHNIDPKYKQKYIKYKTLYLNLKNNTP